jgi:amino acid transporter
MFSSYTLYLGFQHSTTALKNSPAPMGTLADIAGMSWYRPVVDLSLSFTIGASIIAIFTWVARMMFTMSRERIAPSALHRVHRRYLTPTVGLNAAGAVWLVLVVLMGSTSSNPLASYGAVIGEMSGFPLLLVYALICVAAVVYQVRQGRIVTAGIVCGVLGALAMTYVFYRNLVPWPPLPASIVVVAFFVLCGLVVLGYFRLRQRDPERLAGIGASVDADTAAASTEEGPRGQGRPS